jgi:hypothetical protein
MNSKNWLQTYKKNIVFVIFAKQFSSLIIAEYFVDYEIFETSFE